MTRYLKKVLNILERSDHKDSWKNIAIQVGENFQFESPKSASDGSRLMNRHYVKYTSSTLINFSTSGRLSLSLSLFCQTATGHMLTRHSLNVTTPIYTQHFLFTNIATHYKKTLITYTSSISSLSSFSLSLTRIPVFFGKFSIPFFPAWAYANEAALQESHVQLSRPGLLVLPRMAGVREEPIPWDQES